MRVEEGGKDDNKVLSLGQGSDKLNTCKEIISNLVFPLSFIHENQFTWLWSLLGETIFQIFQTTTNIYYPDTMPQALCSAF